MSIISGELIAACAISIRRVFLAFSVASLLGIGLGSLSAAFPSVGQFLLPLNSALRYIPPTSFIGLTIIWFGIGETGKASLIFLSVIFYIVQMSADVISRVPRVYIEAAQTLGASPYEVFARVMLTSTKAEMLAVLRVNLGAAWTFLIVAELVSAQSGLGYLMAVSQRFLQTPRLFAVLITVGLLGYTSDKMFSMLIAFSSRWN